MEPGELPQMDKKPHPIYIKLYVLLREDWPPTNQLKAIDYWSGICYFHVFIALVEYSIVLYLKEYHEHLLTDLQTRSVGHHHTQMQNWVQVNRLIL